jgi:hypothetical protein
MSNAANGNTRLVTDAQGRLLLIRTFPGRTPAETAWGCLWTHGHRRIAAASGTCVHDGSADPVRQAVRTAKRHLRDGTSALAKSDLPSAVRNWTAVGEAEGDARLVARFVMASGAATVRAAGLGRLPSELVRLDARFGADAVDAAFESHPLLGSLLLAHGTAVLVVEVGDAFAAIARGTGLPEAMVSLARRLDDPAVARGALRHPPGVPDEEDADDPFLGYAGAGADNEDHFDFLEDEDLEALADFDPPARVPPAGERGRQPIRTDELPGLPRGDAAACAVLCETAWIPRDWIPGTPDEALCCATILGLAIGIAAESGATLSPRDLVAPAKGRWRAYADQIARAVPSLAVPPQRSWTDKHHASLRNACGAAATEARDMAVRFCDQLVRPACAWATDGATGPEAGVRELELGSWRALFRDKGLAAVLQASATWHTRRTEMDRMVRTLSDGREWPRPFPDITASNGIVATPLLSARELGEEGAHLRHCVGDYVDACHTGRSVIVSLRRRVDGVETRSSTLELRWDPALQAGTSERRPDILQHRGHLNATPPEADVDAAAEIVALLARPASRARPAKATRTAEAVPVPARLAATLRSWERRTNARRDRLLGRPARPPPAVRRVDVAGHRLAEQCGYDWRDPAQLGTALDAWGPFLARDRRTLDAFLSGFGVGRTGPSDLAADRPPGRDDTVAKAFGAFLLAASRVLAAAMGITTRLRFAVVAGIHVVTILVLVGFLPSWGKSGPAARDEGRALFDRFSRALAQEGAPCMGSPGQTCASVGGLLVRGAGSRIEIDHVAEGVPPVRVLTLDGTLAPAWHPGGWKEHVESRLAAAGYADPHADAPSSPAR